MSKLNEVIAVLKTKKAQAQAAKTAAYQTFQKSDLFMGLEKTYQPREEEGETLPPESKNVTTTVSEVVNGIQKAWTDMVDVVLTQDNTNCSAKADVVVDGQTILSDVPAVSLIFLEKELTDLRTMVAAMPTLSLDRNWQYNDGTGLYNTEVVRTHRTKKVQKPIVLYDATEHHPAQTQIITDDVLDGYWNSVSLSGAISATRKKELLERVDTLKEAVISARERANSTDVIDVDGGQAVFQFIFG